MVDRYNARIDELGPRHKDTQAIIGDLLADPVEPRTLAKEEFFGFDLIAVGAALHHFPDPGYAIKVLAERLGPRGVLYIQDMFDNGEKREKEAKGPRGFTEVEMRELMGVAGLADFGFEVVDGETDIELLSEEVLSVKLFAARGRKLG